MSESADTLSPESIISILYGKSCIAHKNGYLSDVTHKPSSSKTKHLRSILDALAGVCLHEKQHQAFAVSISTSQHETPGVTLFISQNGTVQQIVVDHLLNIRARLARIRALYLKTSTELDHLTMVQNAKTALEISIYLHSYEKFRHRLMNVDITNSEYDEFVATNPGTTSEEHALFQDLLIQLTRLRNIMVGCTKVTYDTGRVMVEVIRGLWDKWRPMLEENSGFITRWDKTFVPSLSTNLGKLFRLHEQFLTLSDIATSTRFTQFLDGYFKVRVVDAVKKDLCIDISLEVMRRFFLEAGQDYLMTGSDAGDVHQRIMDNISAWAKIRGLQITDQAGSHNLQQLSFPHTTVHCECTLIAFHHRNPLLSVINYIGLSRRPCYACSQYIYAYNQGAGSQAGRTKFSSRSSSGRIQLPWVCPALASESEERTSCDTEVKQCLVDRLQWGLQRYVEKVVDEICDEKRQAEFLSLFNI